MILIMVLASKGELVVTDLESPMSLNLLAKSSARVLANLGGPLIAGVEAQKFELNCPNIVDLLLKPRSDFRQVD